MENYSNFTFRALQDDNTKAISFDKQTYETSDNLFNACIVLDTDIVVIDVDDSLMVSKISELINKSVITNTMIFKTTRGYHLYYKKPSVLNNIGKKVGIPLACGLVVDFLATTSNDTIVTAKIKENGVLRDRVDNTNIYDKKNLPELPIYFYPLPYGKDKVDSIIDLTTGEGRNNCLFRQLGFIKIQYPNFDDDNLDTIVNFINSYIFKESLSIKELGSLKHSSSQKGSLQNVTEGKSFRDEKGKLCIDALINDIIINYDIISYTDILYIKKKYSTEDFNRIGSELEVARYFKDIIRLNKPQSETLRFHLLVNAKIIEISDELPIRTKNNYELSGNDDDFKEKLSVGFTMFNLDINYDKNAYDKNVDDFLNHVANNDKEVRLVLEEMLGHCLYTKYVPEFAYFLVSNAGKTGKSTFLTMLRNFIGSKLTTSLSLGLMNEQHNIASMSGKLLNIGDDIDGTYIEFSNSFKSIISGTPITDRNLYESPNTYRIVSTLIFSTNKLPRFKDVSGGIERRIVIIPCKNKVSREKLDPMLEEKLSSDNAKSYLLNLAIQGRKRLRHNKNELSYSEVIERETNNYLNLNNSMRSFVYHYDDNGIMLNLILNKNKLGGYDTTSPRDLYNDYNSICVDYGFTPISYKSFTTTLKDVYDIGLSKEGRFIIFDTEVNNNTIDEVGRKWEEYTKKLIEDRQKLIEQKRNRLDNEQNIKDNTTNDNKKDNVVENEKTHKTYDVLYDIIDSDIDDDDDDDDDDYEQDYESEVW